MTIEEALNALNISEDIIPAGRFNRPGERIRPEKVTIHNTANASAGADARMHARFVKNPSTRVSWHFTVDDKRCIKHLPTNEKGFHAGTGAGNRLSIGIEICENKGIDRRAADERAALLAAVMLFSLKLKGADLVPHRHWSGKHCPHLLLDSPGGFDKFRRRVAELLGELTADTPAPSIPIGGATLASIGESEPDDVLALASADADDVEEDDLE